MAAGKGSAKANAEAYDKEYVKPQHVRVAKRKNKQMRLLKTRPHATLPVTRVTLPEASRAKKTEHPNENVRAHFSK